MTINVFIVDDSATARTGLKILLEDAYDMNVLGVASNPLIALKKMQLSIWPDIIISDLVMPEMDGLTFLKEVQEKKPTPFIIFSNYTGSSAASGIEALFKGAVDIIPKPDFNNGEQLEKSRQQMLQAIRAAYETRKSESLVSRFRERKAKRHVNTEPTGKELHVSKQPVAAIAIGSSTGGTSQIERMLSSLEKDCPPVLIVQHMPEYFTQAFARRINTFCKITVKEAEHQELIQPGRAYIAPGGKHMTVENSQQGQFILIEDGPLVNQHCPSVDMLFHSVANTFREQAIGIILTGMGKDGAKGLLDMRNRKALTIAQSPEDCAVYGMPKVAMTIGAAKREMDVDGMIDYLSTVTTVAISVS